MSVESNLKLAEYFEGRAKRERRDKRERERLLAVAQSYRAEAAAELERAADRSSGTLPEDRRHRPQDSDSARR